MHALTRARFVRAARRRTLQSAPAWTKATRVSSILDSGNPPIPAGLKVRTIIGRHTREAEAREASMRQRRTHAG